MSKLKIDNKQERDVESNAVLNTDKTGLLLAKQRQRIQKEQSDIVYDLVSRVTAIEREVGLLKKSYKKSMKK